MKKYKLLKELPGYKVGEKVYAKVSDNTLYLSNPPKYEVEIDNNFFYLTKKEIDERLEEIKNDKKSIFELEKGDEYYFIDDEGIISYETRNNSKENKIDLEFGNIFFTKYDAEIEIERRKALTRIKRRIWKNKIPTEKLGDLGYKIYINGNYGLFVDKYANNKAGIGDIIFSKKEDAEKCLKECKEDREFLFNFK